MILRGLSSLLRKVAHRHPTLRELYRRSGPSSNEWAEFLREHSSFFDIGEHCHINPGAGIYDREYVRIGNNVWIDDCFIVGHDGSIGMINQAFGTRLDKVGKVDIRDNVVIGVGAKILPGVTIGPNAMVGAGSVVVRDVPENTVVSGVPAVPVGKLDEMVEELRRENEAYPWIGDGPVGPKERAAALFERG